MTANFQYNDIFTSGNITSSGIITSISGVFNSVYNDILSFNTNNGAVSLRGQVGWNSTEGTLDIALEDNVAVQVDEHRLLRVRNTTGSQLYKGQVVYASGVHANGIITPNLYVADGTIQEIRFIGLMLADVAINNNGFVIDFGHINNIDTRGNVLNNYAVGDETWADGDILYAHPTVAGKLTKVEPKHAISVAYILDAASNGKIFVRPSNFGDFGQLHDVNISGATNGQFLQYNSSTDYWIPSSSGSLTNLTVSSGSPRISGEIFTAYGNAGVSGLLKTNNLIYTPVFNSPSALSSNQGDYNPGSGEIIRLSTSISGIAISGMVPLQEYVRVLINIGSSGNIRLKHEALSATAANRFITPNGGDYIVAPTGAATILYDSTSSRWRVL